MNRRALLTGAALLAAPAAATASINRSATACSDPK